MRVASAMLLIMIFIGTQVCNLLEDAMRLHLQPGLDMTCAPSCGLLICMLYLVVPQQFLHVIYWPPLHDCPFLSLHTSALLARFALRRALPKNLSS